MSRLAVVFFAVVLATATLAADEPWASAAVKPGMKVVVMDACGCAYRGRLLEWDAEAVALETEAGRVEIAREQVALIRAPGPLGNLQTVYAPWANLMQVPAGHPIRIVRAEGLPVNGEVFAIRDDGIQVTRGRKLDFIGRDEIRKVKILARSKTDIGYKVGASTGFVAAILALMAGATQGAGLGPGTEDALQSIIEDGGKAGATLDRLFDEYQTIYLAQRKQK